MAIVPTRKEVVREKFGEPPQAPRSSVGEREMNFRLKFTPEISKPRSIYEEK
jgi:hypothetical protein